MKVLIITHIFWPEVADFKNFALAKGLVDRGHKVTVLTAFPNYPLGHLYAGYKLNWRQWEQVDGVRILRVPLYPDQSSSGLKRFLNYGSFTLSSSTIGLMLAGSIDVIFVNSPPMTLGLTAGLFKLFHRVPIVLDVVDLWPDAVYGSGMASDFIAKISGLIAMIAYRLADKITVLTDGFKSRVASVGVPDGIISVMPPWADNKLYFSTDCNPEFGKKYKLHGKFCIIHAGNIGPFQDIENVLAAAEQLLDVDNLLIVFVGGGQDLEKMKRKASGLANIIFAGIYPSEKMAGILAWGNALLVSLRADSYLSINLPSKVPSYLACGKPIIACADGETGQLIENNHVGLSCAPGNPTLLAETIKRFMALPEEERIDMGKRSWQTFEMFYDKDKLIGKYISMLETMVLRR